MRASAPARRNASTAPNASATKPATRAPAWRAAARKACTRRVNRSVTATTAISGSTTASVIQASTANITPSAPRQRSASPARSIQASMKSFTASTSSRMRLTVSPGGGRAARAGAPATSQPSIAPLKRASIPRWNAVPNRTVDEITASRASSAPATRATNVQTFAPAAAWPLIASKTPRIASPAASGRV